MIGKKPAGLVITIIVLVIIVVALGLSILSSKNPLNSIVRNYQHNYPDSLLSIQKLRGENAQAAGQQISVYCPGFSLEEYYLAQITNPSLHKSILFIINPVTGRTECVIDKSTNINASKATLTQNLLATINNEPVYMQEVLAVYNNIPQNMRTNTSLQESLEQVINNKLLLQDAARKGLSVSEEEVDNAINTFLANNGLTLQQLEDTLVSSGSSIDLFRNNIRNSLLLQQEIRDITKNISAPSEAEVRAYYDQNNQTFTTIPGAVTRQLLIYANETNQAEKLGEIKAIAAQYNGTNFCDLVSKYSEDNLSVSRCGLYDFQQGQLLPEYEQVVFNSEPGTTKIIRTRLGYHIVQIINITLPRQLSFEEAKKGISNYLVLLKKQAVLNQYIQSFREQANITSYIGQK